jgi:tetratricopeptide (TPR) repeat protein
METIKYSMAANRRVTYTWGWAVIVVAGALFLAWAGWPRNARQGNESLPAPTATTPIRAERRRILVTDFEGRDEGRHTGRAPEEDIYQALLDRVRADGLDLHVERLNEVADEFSAAYLGQSNDATLVVWGWYDDTHAQPYVEQIEAPPGRLSTLPFCALDDPPTQVPHIAWFTLAVHAHSQGRHTHALQYLDAIMEDLTCGSVHNQQGLVHRALGNYDAALAAFSRAIVLEPENARFYANRGATFEAIEQYHAAHADFARAWELTRDLATLFN